MSRKKTSKRARFAQAVRRVRVLSALLQQNARLPRYQRWLANAAAHAQVYAAPWRDGTQPPPAVQAAHSTHVRLAALDSFSFTQEQLQLMFLPALPNPEMLAQLDVDPFLRFAAPTMNLPLKGPSIQLIVCGDSCSRMLPDGSYVNYSADSSGWCAFDCTWPDGETVRLEGDQARAAITQMHRRFGR